MRSSCMWPQAPQRTMSASAVPKRSVVGTRPSGPIAPATRMCGWSEFSPHATHFSETLTGARLGDRFTGRMRYFGMGRNPLLVSVVAPVFCEAETIEVFYERVRTALEGF